MSKKKNERKILELYILENSWFEKKRYTISNVDNIFYQEKYKYILNIRLINTKLQAIKKLLIGLSVSQELLDYGKFNKFENEFNGFCSNFKKLVDLFLKKKISNSDFFIGLKNNNNIFISIFDIKKLKNKLNYLSPNMNNLIIIEILKFIYIKKIVSSSIFLNFESLTKKKDLSVNLESIYYDPVTSDRIATVDNEIMYRGKVCSNNIKSLEYFGIFLNNELVNINSIGSQNKNKILYFEKNTICIKDYFSKLINSEFYAKSWIYNFTSANSSINLFLNRFESKKIQVRGFWFRPGQYVNNDNYGLREIFSFWKNNQKISYNLKKNKKWFYLNSKILNLFRVGFGLIDEVVQGRSSRNNNKIFRKYNKLYNNYLNSIDFLNKKKVNYEIDSILGFGRMGDYTSLGKHFDYKKKELVSYYGKYSQDILLNFKKPFFIYRNNDIFKLHFNFLRNKQRNELKNLKFDFSDRERRLNMLSYLYKYSNSQDLNIQQNISDTNRWGSDIGRGGFDWLWLRMSKYGNLTNRFSLEKGRFYDSWKERDYDISRKSLKYITENQYTMRLLRSKYFNKEISKKNNYYALDNNLFNLKYDMLSGFYNLGSFGQHYYQYSNKTENNVFDGIFNNIINRIKQPIRAYLREKSPYMRHNYVLLHQKLLNTYLNKKSKYQRIRFLLKPVGIYFRDFFRFNFNLKNINHICRNQINLINLNIANSFSYKLKITRTKKFILNSRILYKKNFLKNRESFNFFGFFNKFFKTVLVGFYSDISKNNISLDQIKKIIKWEFSLNSKLSLINKKDLLHKNNLNFASLNNITDLVSNIRFSKNNKFLLDFNDDSKKKIKDILSFLFLNDRFYLIKKEKFKNYFFFNYKKDFFKIFFFLSLMVI